MAIFNSGTKTIFHQTSAPTGWTKETVNYDNHALRVVTGSSLSTGGSVNFDTAFSTSPYTYSSVPLTYFTGLTTLDVTQIPVHNHTVTPAPTRAYYGAPRTMTAPPPATQPVAITVTSTTTPSSSSGDLSHDHTIGVSASGTVFSNSPNTNLAVNYIDVIIATLN